MAAEATADRLRFAAGDRVECNLGRRPNDRVPGTVVEQWYREKDWPEGKVVPYQVRLDDGRYVYVLMDTDVPCRALVPGEGVAATGTAEQPVIGSEDDKTEEKSVIESADDNDLTAGQSSYGLPFRKRIVFTFGAGQMTSARVQYPNPAPRGLGRDEGGDHRQKR